MVGGGVMCAFLVDLVDFDKLTDKQRKILLKNLHRERKAVESQLEAVESQVEQASQTLKALDRSIKVAERKSKSKRRS
jgi:hypothetical protein